MSKYNNRKTMFDGILFDSMAEADRYVDLLCLEKEGDIIELTLQPKINFLIEGKKIFTYIADFQYYKKGKTKLTIEDVKGFQTPVFRLKKKLIEAQHKVVIELIK